MVLLCVPAVGGRGIAEVADAVQRSGSPSYLPVRYSLQHAEAFFLHSNAPQDLMRNCSLRLRTESFFVHRARQVPLLNAAYKQLTAQLHVPLELLLQTAAVTPLPLTVAPTAVTPDMATPPFTFNWKISAHILSPQVQSSWPRLQVLFHVAGRGWAYSGSDPDLPLPCVKLSAFHETQEVSAACRLRGELGLCVAELEAPPAWFAPPTVQPGRHHRAPQQVPGTPVELYYSLQGVECGGEEMEQRQQQQPMAGHASSMQRIGSVRLLRPLAELRLDTNFLLTLPSAPLRQRGALSAFLGPAMPMVPQAFTLR